MKNWIVFKMITMNGKELIAIQKGVEGLEKSDKILSSNLTRLQARSEMVKFSRLLKIDRVKY